MDWSGQYTSFWYKINSTHHFTIGGVGEGKGMGQCKAETRNESKTLHGE